jgi:hypothetical protein
VAADVGDDAEPLVRADHSSGVPAAEIRAVEAEFIQVHVRVAAKDLDARGVLAGRRHARQRDKGRAENDRPKLHHASSTSPRRSSLHA